MPSDFLDDTISEKSTQRLAAAPAVAENIVLRHGNLLTSEAEALVNAVNCVGVMGKGIALAFKIAFPTMFREYRRACKSGEVQLGRVQIIPVEEEGRRLYVVNFPTVQHWGDPSHLAAIESGLESLVQEVRRLQIRSLALPALGCGSGKLDWDDVRPRIEAAFSALPDVKVFLYAPGSG